MAFCLQDFWAKREANALKEPRMKRWKKAHSFRQRGMLKSNVGKVFQALLSNSKGSERSQGTPEATQTQGTM